MISRFHCAHVIIAIIFLSVCLFSVRKDWFTPQDHLCFDFASWYQPSRLDLFWSFYSVPWPDIKTSYRPAPRVAFSVVDRAMRLHIHDSRVTTSSLTYCNDWNNQDNRLRYAPSGFKQLTFGIWVTHTTWRKTFTGNAKEPAQDYSASSRNAW